MLISLIHNAHYGKWVDQEVQPLDFLQAEEATQEEIESGRVVKRRVDHLKDHDSLSPSVVAEWKRTRLDRLLVEYLLRAGCYSTATKVQT